VGQYGQLPDRRIPTSLRHSKGAPGAYGMFWLSSMYVGLKGDPDCIKVYPGASNGFLTRPGYKEQLSGNLLTVLQG
jgi:hypothetical protein